MNSVKGIFKPADYFRVIASKDGKTLVGEMLKKIIFIISFFSIIAYLSVLGFTEKMGIMGEATLATKSAIDSGLWAFSTFLLHGLIAAVVAKLFSVDERISVIVTCYFWSHLYGWIAGFLMFALTFCLALLITADIQFAIISSVIPFIIVKVWYLMKGTEISMQTSKIESVAILILSSVLLFSLNWCLNEATSHYFSKEMMDLYIASGDHKSDF
ncbi:hypothetical protein [Vibrio hepatarius]|uniref:hypothetical protein n=1 Tax=Vibrio hepatarius TaxID=171383 RepID=UPI001C08181E|nr:hypothetical protein [Vibrio hepatarius]MBU2898315.1 hypothetical protein [Vibrio hepatarius]